MKLKQISRTRQACIRGQGMTEYIIVALIAIAAIGVTTAFGKTARSQVAAMAAGLGGDQTQADAARDDAKTAAAAAQTQSNATAKGLANFSDDVAAK